MSRIAIWMVGLVGFCAGLGSATAYWKRQPPVAEQDLPPPSSTAPAALPPPRLAPAALGCLDEARMRQLLDQALDQKLAAVLVDRRPPQVAGPAAPEVPGPEAQAAATEVQRRIQAALARGTWTEEDREAARVVAGKLTFTARQQLLQQIVEAVNAGQLKMGGPEAPL